MLLSERVWISNHLLHVDGGGNSNPGENVNLWSMSSHDDVRDELHDDVHDVREKVSFLP